MVKRKQETTVRLLTVPEAAYLAGIIDGEGSVRVERRYTASVQTVDIQVGSTSRDLIDWLLGIGGRLTTFNPGPGHLGKKTLWRWGLYPQVDVEVVLEMVLPFLIIKRPEAEQALAWLREKNLARKVG